MTYKCMNHLAPSYLSSKFVKRSDIHNRRTRNREALQIPFFRSAVLCLKRGEALEQYIS